jgi:energy-coupling factor transporter transmembrane protein EcfT
MEKTQEPFFKESGERIEAYIKDSLLLFKLQGARKISRLAAMMFVVLVVALLVFFIMLFLSAMLGYYFAELTGSLYLGFGILSALYIIVAIVLIKLRKPLLEKLITNTVINILFDSGDDAEEEEETSHKPNHSSHD